MLPTRTFFGGYPSPQPTTHLSSFSFGLLFTYYRLLLYTNPSIWYPEAQVISSRIYCLPQFNFRTVLDICHFDTWSPLFSENIIIKLDSFSRNYEFLWYTYYQNTPTGFLDDMMEYVFSNEINNVWFQQDSTEHFLRLFLVSH